MTTYDFVAANKRKSWFLIVIFTAIVLGIGYGVDRMYSAGGSFIVIAAAYALISGLVSYYAGDKVALASSGAREVTAADNAYLVRMVENLCIASGTPTPKIHVIEDDAINAFATGRDPEHASIAVTTGALRKLENEELEGVLAHELSHVRNYDIRVLTLVVVLVGTVSLLSDFALRGHLFGGKRDSENSQGAGIFAIVGIVLIVLSPIVAELIKLAVSRRREYLADASGALLTRYPEGLARALEKIAQDSKPMARASSATAHLFFASPFAGKTFAQFFSTHPPVEKRVEALRKMGGIS
jgi:heat shock protein HtpX